MFENLNRETQPVLNVSKVVPLGHSPGKARSKFRSMKKISFPERPRAGKVGADL
jgi:hypothetical protein